MWCSSLCTGAYAVASARTGNQLFRMISTRYVESIPNNLNNMDKNWSKYSEDARDFVARLLTNRPQEAYDCGPGLAASLACFTSHQIATDDIRYESGVTSTLPKYQFGISSFGMPARSLFQQAFHQLCDFSSGCPVDYSWSKHCNNRTGGENDHVCLIRRRKSGIGWRNGELQQFMRRKSIDISKKAWNCAKKSMTFGHLSKSMYPALLQKASQNVSS